MLELQTQCNPLEPLMREKGSKSVLLDACLLSEQLLEASDPWALICQAWIEMLTNDQVIVNGRHTLTNSVEEENCLPMYVF